MNNIVISRLFRGNTHTKWRIGANILTHNRQRKCIKDLLQIAQNKMPMTSVLDCPAGSGRMVDLLLSWKVTCADISRSRLVDIRRYFPDNEIEIKECDIFNLPFKNDEFDLALNFLLIQHIDKSRLQSMLKELRRVTKRWLIVTYPSKFSLVNIYRFFFKKRKTLLTKSEFSDLVYKSGFRVVESRSVLPFIANGKVVLLEKMLSTVQN